MGGGCSTFIAEEMEKDSRKCSIAIAVAALPNDQPACLSTSQSIMLLTVGEKSSRTRGKPPPVSPRIQRAVDWTGGASPN